MNETEKDILLEKLRKLATDLNVISNLRKHFEVGGNGDKILNDYALIILTEMKKNTDKLSLSDEKVKD